MSLPNDRIVPVGSRLSQFINHSLSTLIPLMIALIGLGTLVLAPIWALQWYQEPFIGIFLEPNLVVSQIGAPDWPARQAGVQFSDRLVAIDGIPVTSSAQLRRHLVEKGFQPVALSFERRNGSPFQVMVTPRHVQSAELLLQFVIPYLVGAALWICGLWVYRMGKGRLPARAFLLFTSAATISSGAFLDMNITHHMVLGWTLSLVIAAGALVHLALLFPPSTWLLSIAIRAGVSCTG